MLIYEANVLCILLPTCLTLPVKFFSDSITLIYKKFFYYFEPNKGVHRFLDTENDVAS